ncbi:MAG: phosphoribosylglycinamide formyltransferase [Bacteroidetes bacterium]|nr:phosphoribosylglycinamide formyltransferase [Bacteroidota bacterium]
MANIAILASGSGTNAQRISEYFSDHPSIHIKLILSNNPDAYVLTRALQLGIPSGVFTRDTFYKTGAVCELLRNNDISFIVLAGFLWLIPRNILEAYPRKIVNIHPALLPGYGGKGMYGEHVHEAVIRSGERESGISIHYVNEKYDEGNIIFQARCPVMPGDTPASLAARIHKLEYEHYPRVIEEILTSDIR